MLLIMQCYTAFEDNMKRKVIATLAVPILLALLVICGYNYNVDSTQATESSLTDELQSVYVTSQPDKSYDVVVFGTSTAFLN